MRTTDERGGRIMTIKEYNKKLAELRKKQAELDKVYYDESDPCAFDGGCIMELHQLADEALALASGRLVKFLMKVISDATQIPKNSLNRS